MSDTTAPRRSTEGMFIELHTVAGGERRSEQITVSLYVRVDDIVVMESIPEMGRAGVPTGDFVGSHLRLRRAGEVAVLESPEEIVEQIHRGLFPGLIQPTEGEPT